MLWSNRSTGVSVKNRSGTDLCHPKFGFRYTLVVPSLGRWWSGMFSAFGVWDGTGYHINSFCQKLDTPQRTPLLYCIPWRIHGAAIYGVPWNPSTKTPVMLAFFYQHQPDPMIRGWESDGISVQVLSGLVFLPWKIHKVPHKESHEISHELHLPSSSLT